jgi:hypothetical protein
LNQKENKRETEKMLAEHDDEEEIPEPRPKRGRKRQQQQQQQQSVMPTVKQEPGLNEFIRKSVERIVLTRGPNEVILQTSFDHPCSHDMCSPMCERDLIEQKRLPAESPVFHPAVYVCCFGKVHVCTQDMCSFYIGTPNGVCPVTGIYHGHTEGEKAWVMPEKRTAHFRRTGVAKGMNSRDALQSRAESEQQHQQMLQTYMAQFQAKVATGPQNAFGALFQKTEAGLKQQQQIPDDPEMVPVKIEPGLPIPPPISAPQQTSRGLNRKKIRRMPLEAEEIITTLLYSDTRQILNDEKRSQLNGERDNEIQRYYERISEAKTFPILMEVVSIRAGYDYEPEKLVILKTSKQRIDLYVRWIMDLWNFVVASPWFQHNPGECIEIVPLSLTLFFFKGTISGCMQ